MCKAERDLLEELRAKLKYFEEFMLQALEQNDRIGYKYYSGAYRGIWEAIEVFEKAFEN